MTEYILQQASAVVKSFFQIFKDPSNDPPDPLPPRKIQTFFPTPFDDRVNAIYWTCEVLSVYLVISKESTFLHQLQHCKSLQSPAHEFLMAYFITEIDGTSFEMGVTLDRYPEKPTGLIRSLFPRDLELSKHCPSHFPLASPPSSGNAMQDTGKSGEYYHAAINSIIVPAFGTWGGLERIAEEAFGPYKVLNTVKDTHMSAAQFATLIDVIDDFAPMYTPMYQCSWFAMFFFYMVRDETGSKEYPCKDIDERGKQLGMTEPSLDPCDDEETVSYHYRRRIAKL
ncbi:hypothetical protein DFJ58DRAFT_808936 [Suillus subalutaceus]|uniref:uncharacterized protein n=1 Tax=Suillus subalutaceus TaxID=48586 RepID=UPI001B86F83F|nr:uncharacterized protein DFJ58DRAFT_808936 [Suillus subalutaceus]KAG1841102.1 hypothetical protein DFJ58DRAFT_808936 [Suillus subalutaceus]